MNQLRLFLAPMIIALAGVPLAATTGADPVTDHPSSASPAARDPLPPSPVVASVRAVPPGREMLALSSPEPTPPPIVIETHPPAADDVVALLDELERSAQDLELFTAEITYRTEEALLGDVVLRKGRLIYSVDPATKAKRFAIDFDSMIENNRRRDRIKRYIFADGWLVEIDPQEKLFIKRQIVAPGETFDPLKLGEGPIPLPIGQSRAGVLRQFEVTLLDPPQDGPLRRIADDGPVDGMRLVPRSNQPLVEEFARVDLFYDRATRLPVGIDVTEVNGDRKTAVLDTLRRNPPQDEDLRSRLSVEEPDPAQWHIDRRPLAR